MTKQELLGTTIKHDKKAKIKIEYGHDSDWKKDWGCEIEEEEDKSCHISYHSSGGYNCGDVSVEEKLEYLIKDLKEELLTEGYKAENITVEEVEESEEGRLEQARRFLESEKSNLPMAENSLAIKRKELLEAINRLKEHKEKIQKFEDILKNEGR